MKTRALTARERECGRANEDVGADRQRLCGRVLRGVPRRSRAPYTLRRHGRARTPTHRAITRTPPAQACSLLAWNILCCLGLTNEANIPATFPRAVGSTSLGRDECVRVGRYRVRLLYSQCLTHVPKCTHVRTRAHGSDARACTCSKTVRGRTLSSVCAGSLARARCSQRQCVTVR